MALTRIQDDRLAHAVQTEQVWNFECWMERFGLPSSRGNWLRHQADNVAPRKGSGE